MNADILLTSEMLMPLAPVLIVAMTILVVMVAVALKRSNFLAGTLSVVGLNIALLALLIQIFGRAAKENSFFAQLYQLLSPSNGLISTLFIVDGFAQFNMLIVLICALACFTLSYAYIDGYHENKEELHLLMLTATLGAMLMVCSEHLAAFFMSLELLSVPMYGMLAYTFVRSHSLEAGLKYLVLSATASATMLMGMALLYSQLGTLAFRPMGMGVFYLLQQSLLQPVLTLGVAMMVFGVAFKLSAVPFHTWTPDVYQGAPAPVAAFLASVAKVAMLVLGLRFLLTSTTLMVLPAIEAVLVVMAILSMLVGNLLALRQKNIKRMLSYSSIAHLGYVLAVVVSLQGQSDAVASLYMAVYALTSIGLFGVISIMSSPYQQKGEAELMSHYRGLFWQRPILTAVMTVMLLSLAGVPLTAGFISKFFAIMAIVTAENWLLAATIIIGSAISLYYYLTFMITLFKRPLEEKPFDAVNHWGIQAGGIVIMVVTMIVLYYGIFPDGLTTIFNIAQIAR